MVEKNGILIITLPNSDSILQNFMRSEDIPRHLFMYTPETLKTWLLKCGFKDVEIEFKNDVHTQTCKEILVFW